VAGRRKDGAGRFCQTRGAGTQMMHMVPFCELLSGCERSAFHLEMRDRYGDPVYEEWRAGRPVDTCPAYRDWYALISAAVARGVKVRRARVVSEPFSDYVRFEYEVTPALNIAAGERVRWLPRRSASDLLLPGNDFWVFDHRLVRFHHFDGNGEQLGTEVNEDPVVVRLCARAFKQVWARAVDHRSYQPA